MTLAIQFCGYVLSWLWFDVEYGILFKMALCYWWALTRTYELEYYCCQRDTFLLIRVLVPMEYLMKKNNNFYLVFNMGENRLVTIWASFFLSFWRQEGYLLSSGSLYFFIQWSVSQHLISLSSDLHFSLFLTNVCSFLCNSELLIPLLLLIAIIIIIATVVTITTTVTNATYCKKYNCCPFSGTCL